MGQVGVEGSGGIFIHAAGPQDHKLNLEVFARPLSTNIVLQLSVFCTRNLPTLRCGWGLGYVLLAGNGFDLKILFQAEFAELTPNAGLLVSAERRDKL